MVRARLYGKDEATLTLYLELPLVAEKRRGSRSYLSYLRTLSAYIIKVQREYILD